MRPTLDQALALHRAGRTAEAERCYEEVIEADPESKTARHGLGVLLLQTGRASEALVHLHVAASGQPSDAGVLNALGAAQMQTGDLVDATSSFRAAVALDRNHSQALSNLGVALLQLNDPAAATDALRKASQIDPSNADTLYNYSQALRASGDHDDAERVAREALSLAPDPAVAHHNLSHILLQSGRFAEGWLAFEWRWQTEEFKGAEVLQGLPVWNGQRLAEGTLLLWTEQGVGDQILYSSMIAELEGMAPRIVVACMERLVPLFSRSFPFADVVAIEDLSSKDTLLSGVTAQRPAGSLGQFLRPNMTSFPGRESFLRADQARSESLKKRYRHQSDDRPVIGLSWRSSNPGFGLAKSMELVDLAGAFRDTDATFIDLQYGDTSADRAAAKQNGFDLFTDPGVDPLTDLDGFAAQVAAMDLVVTTSNTTAHVAGALGVPCWVLVPAGGSGFWYWFLDRDDSPWYPSLRLFRQVTPGVWADTINDVRAALT